MENSLFIDFSLIMYSFFIVIIMFVAIYLKCLFVAIYLNFSTLKQVNNRKFKYNLNHTHMIRPKSINQPVSSRNSTCSIDKSNNPTSRRSSFVQTLIAQYKNTSHQKSQKHSTPSHTNITKNNKNITNKINFNTSVGLNKHNTGRQRQNMMPDQLKSFLTKRTSLKIAANQNPLQQVHFPLKDMNFMQKYRSTQLPKQQQALNCLSRKGSHAKKKHSNPLISNIDSNYESQFLKTMFMTKAKVDSDDKMLEMKFYEKKTQGINNFDVHDLFSNHNNHSETDNFSRFLVKELEASESSFLKDCQKVVHFLLAERHQQGLNELLKMRKKLKQVGSKYQYGKSKANENTRIMSIVQQRQLMTLFLYGMIVMDLNQNSKEKELVSILEKIDKKIKNLQRHIGHKANEQFLICIIILEINILFTPLKQCLQNSDTTMRVESIDQGKRLKQVEYIDSVKRLVNQCQQIKICQQMPGLNELLDFVSLIINQWSQNQRNNNRQIVLQAIKQSGKKQLLRLLMLQSANWHKQTQQQFNKQTEIRFPKNIKQVLIERTILKTISGVMSELSAQIRKEVLDQIRKEVRQNQRKQKYSYELLKNYSGRSLRIEINDNSGKETSKVFYSEFIKNYQILIEQAIILKSFTTNPLIKQSNTPMDTYQNQILIEQAIILKSFATNPLIKQSNTPMDTYQIKQTQLRQIQKQMTGLRNLFRKIKQVKTTEEHKFSQDQSSSSYLQIMLGFPGVFMHYYSVLNEMALNEQQKQAQQQQRQTRYLFEVVKLLQLSETSVKEYIEQVLFIQESQANFRQIQFPFSQTQLNPHSLLAFSQTPLNQLKSLSYWINLELIRVYFHIGELSTAYQRIIQNQELILNYFILNTTCRGTNHAKVYENNKIEKLKDEQSTNYHKYKQFNWQKNLNEYVIKNQLDLVFMLWRTMSFTSQLNLSPSVDTTSQLNLSPSVHNSFIYSQIFINLFHLKLSTSDAHYDTQLVNKLLGDTFSRTINLKDKTKGHKEIIAVQIKRLLQIYTSLSIISKTNQRHKSDELGVPVDTFEDQTDEQVDEDEFNGVYEEDCGDNRDFSMRKMKQIQSEKLRKMKQIQSQKLSKMQQIQSQKLSQYSKSGYGVNEDNQERLKAIELKNVLIKIKKPYQYHVNYLKSQFNKQNQFLSLKCGQLEQAFQVLSQIMTEMKEQFDILLQLH